MKSPGQDPAQDPVDLEGRTGRPPRPDRTSHPFSTRRFCPATKDTAIWFRERRQCSSGTGYGFALRLVMTWGPCVRRRSVPEWHLRTRPKHHCPPFLSTERANPGSRAAGGFTGKQERGSGPARRGLPRGQGGGGGAGLVAACPWGRGRTPPAFPPSLPPAPCPFSRRPQSSSCRHNPAFLSACGVDLVDPPAESFLGSSLGPARGPTGGAAQPSCVVPISGVAFSGALLSSDPCGGRARHSTPRLCRAGVPESPRSWRC